MVLTAAPLSGLVGFEFNINMPEFDCFDFKTEASAASYLSIEEASRYASLLFEAGSSAYEEACSALTGESQGTPETWASIARGLSLFAGVASDVNWNDLLPDASAITTSNLTHITGAISGMFSVIDSIENITESENVLRTSLEGMKIVKGLFTVFGKGSVFPSTLSLVMVSVDATLSVAGFLADQYFKEALTFYEAELQIEYYTDQPLTYKTIDKAPSLFISKEKAQQAYDILFYKYYTKRMVDRIGSGSGSGGEQPGNEVQVDSISMSQTRYVMFINENASVKAVAYPENAVNREITYTSSSNAVSVSPSGSVFAANEGTATITAKTSNGTSATVRITVLPFKVDFKNNEYSIREYCGTSLNIVFPGYVDNYPVTRISSLMLCTEIDPTDIQSIVFSDTIRTIGQQAFQNCTSLSSLTFPSSIELIEPWAFQNCKNLTTLTFPKDASMEIEYCAFEGCISLETVSLDGVREMSAGRAFAGCTKLKTAYISSIAENVTGSTFLGCESLEVLKVDPENQHYSNDSKYNLYNKDKSELILYCPGQKDELFQIPDSVETIKRSAFAEQKHIKHIKMSDNVDTIENDAFMRCSSLIEVDLSNSIEVIDKEVFYQCEKLNKISLDNIKTINDSAFHGCISLTNVYMPVVEKIGEFAFYGCSALKEITMACSAECQDFAFYNYNHNGYPELEKVTLTKGTGVMTAYNWENYYYLPWNSGDSELETQKKINVVIEDGVENIGAYAFYCSPFVSSVSIPDTVKRIDNRAFYDCSALEELLIPNSVTVIDDYAIYGSYTNLKKLVVGNGVDINNFTLYDIEKLETLVLGDSVTSIPDNMFRFCSNLSSITFGNGLKRIGINAFSYCSSLSEITIPGNVEIIDEYAFCNCENLLKVIIKDGTIKIGDYAFEGCRSLVSVSLPASITDIGLGALDASYEAHFLFRGSEADWCNINFGSVVYNTIHYNMSECDELILINTREPSCIDYGMKEFLCPCGETVCLYTDDVIGHSKDEIVQVVSPKCTSSGYTVYRCLRCDETFNEDYTSSLGGHTEGELVNDILPTCTELGKKDFICSVCGEVWTTKINPLGHNFENKTCTICRKSADDCIESEHNYSNNTDSTWTIYKPNAKSIEVLFSSATYLENHCDYIYIYDSEELIGSYTYNSLASKTIVVLGDTVRIRLITDSSVTYYGFSITDINVNYTKLEKPTNADTIITNNYIYGLKSGIEIKNLSDYIFVPESYKLSCDSDLLSTGSKLFVIDNKTEAIIEEIEIVIFGDTNGDSWYDGQDAVLVSCLANGMLTKEDVGEAVYMAADCNHDGVIDEADVALLNQAGTLLANVDQTKSSEELLETSSEYVEYISLIDQSPEIEAEGETEIDTEVDVETEETPEADIETTPEQDEIKEASIFEMIFNFIKSIFEILLAYIPVSLK